MKDTKKTVAAPSRRRAVAAIRELKQDARRSPSRAAGRSAGQDARCPRRRRLGRQAERSARRGRELRGRHPGRHRVRAHPDEVGDAQQDQRRARPARAGRLRQLLRVRRGDRREAAARAAVRGPLQGLRRGARRSPSSASVSSSRGAAPRRCSSTCKHPASRRLGAPPVAEPVSSPPAVSRNSISAFGMSTERGRHERSHRGPQVRGRLDRRSAARRFRRSCRSCRFGTPSCFRTRSCRSPWRAKAPSA